jgi:hypothetical protein
MPCLDRAVRHVSKAPFRDSANQEKVLANQPSRNRSRETTMQDVSASFIRQLPGLPRLVIFCGYELQHKYGVRTYILTKKKKREKRKRKRKKGLDSAQTHPERQIKQRYSVIG